MLSTYIITGVIPVRFALAFDTGKKQEAVAVVTPSDVIGNKLLEETKQKNCIIVCKGGFVSLSFFFMSSAD